ncbi:MAG: sulfatase-like hydrolase/transferase [Anaerolineae bacterium]|nr:sulfatase-like hydrolase/transferase [Anaerolineae bacterium]
MNIVLIMADQLAAGMLGCYGSGVDSTPTLDSLAEHGVQFNRCYATSPVCAPNRATMLTGRSPVIHGIITNNYVLATDMPTYAHVLQAYGYRTGGFGKFHQTPMHYPVPENVTYLGFDESVISEDPKWGPWLDWVRRNHPEHYRAALSLAWPQWPNSPSPDEKQDCLDAQQAYLQPLQDASPWYLMHPSPLPPEVHDSTFITDISLDFMQRHIAAHPDQPFFCHVSYVDPHDPYDPPEPYASMYDPAEMDDPIPAEWLDQGFTALEQAQKFHIFDTIYDKPDIVRKLRALYHGSLRYLDDQIARIVSYLKVENLWEDTILVFTTDHGDLLGDHGQITKGVKPYDKSIRCPLIVAGGGTQPAVTERLTCTLDFYPTICDWAQIPPEGRPPLEGKSFARHVADGGDGAVWPEVSVAIGGAESVITGDRWRLTRFLDDDKGQMINLETDAAEQHNLYDDPLYQEKRQELLERLIYVMALPRRLPQYRNMPLINGSKVPIRTDQLAAGTRYYPSTTPPLLKE